MRETDYSQIAFGRGGEILDVPKNEELLKQIRATPVLESKELLKLAIFYQGYPTNKPLADHLALVALMRLISDPSVEKAIITAINTGEITTAKVASANAADKEDYDDPEDYLEAPWGIPNDDDSVRGQHWVIRRVPISGVELLIETPLRKGHHERHYVIGVSPDPQSL